MIVTALITAFIASIAFVMFMSSDDSRMGHTYASQKRNMKVVSEMGAYVFAGVFLLVIFLAAS